MSTFQVLNVELNGDKPSESTNVASVVPREVPYAIAEIARALRVADRPDAAWLVDIAWLGVLAGDTDDIEGQVADEWRGRRA